MRKFLSMLLALTMILAMLAACNNNVDDPIDDPNQEVQGDEVVDDGKLTLVSEGETDYVIVRGENCSPSELTASTELQSYLKQISGVEIPIVTDSTKAAKKEIIVGKTNREAEGQFDREELGNDGFVIKSEGKKLWLVGGEQRGTLYSVYSFLEEYLGVRYYTAEIEKIPEMTTISLEDITENKQIPTFVTREALWYELHSAENSDEFYAKLKQNMRRFLSPISEDFGGSETWAGAAGHTLFNLAEMTGAAWFNEPCLTSEDVYNTVLKNVRAWLEANPTAKYISVSQNDGDNNRVGCECDNCMAVYNKYGCWTGVYLEFVNRIAREIKDEYPDVMVHTLAYTFNRLVPEGLVPEDNVMVQLCTIEACFRHPLEEYKERTPEEKYNYVDDFAVLLKDWSAVCKYLSVWDYCTDFGHYNMTYPDFEVLRENMLLFAENNVKDIYENGAHNCASGEFAELRAYLQAKLMWDPYMSEDEYNAHMNDFLQGVYGSGWEGIRNYIDLAQVFTEDIHLIASPSPTDVFIDYEIIKLNQDVKYPADLTADMIINYKNVDWLKYWNFFAIPEFTGDHVVKAGREAFDNALALAENDMQKLMCDKSSIQIAYLETYMDLYTLEKCTGSIGKIVLNYYKDHPDQFDITQSEFLDLRREILAFSNQQYKDAYYAINRKLAEKMVKYGVGVKEGNPYISLDTINYWDVPYNWEDPIA